MELRRVMGRVVHVEDRTGVVGPGVARRSALAGARVVPHDIGGTGAPVDGPGEALGGTTGGGL